MVQRMPDEPSERLPASVRPSVLPTPLAQHQHQRRLSDYGIALIVCTLAFVVSLALALLILGPPTRFGPVGW